MLTDTQHEYLIRPLKPSRVEKTQGMAYLEAFDVIAHLTRVFGWEGWDKELLQLDLIFESTGNEVVAKPRWTVAYRCSMRLTIRDPHGIVVKVVEDVGTGEAINQPSRGDAHDLASKSAVSGALKRCAKDLGDGFGLGLYDKGSLEPCVKTVIAYDPVLVLTDHSQPPPARPESSPAEGAPASVPVHSTQGDPPAVAGETLEQKAERLAGIKPSTLTISEPQNRKIRAMLRGLEVPEDEYHSYLSAIVGRPIESFTDLFKADAHTVIEELTNRQKSWTPRPGEEMF